MLEVRKNNANPGRKYPEGHEPADCMEPLGNKADSIKDLDNYRTEAIDILFNLDLRGPKTAPARIIRDVLNQAFDLSLSLEECMEVGRKILEQFSDT